MGVGLRDDNQLFAFLLENVDIKIIYVRSVKIIYVKFSKSPGRIFFLDIFKIYFLKIIYVKFSKFPGRIFF